VDPRAALMLGAYNAMSELAWLGLCTLARTGLVGENWRLDQRTGHYEMARGLRQGKSGRSFGLWIHAASVGEVRAAGALARSLSEYVPGDRVLLSVLTTTGLDSARQKLPQVDAIVQAPVDLKGPVGRVLSWFDPSLLLLVETEIWPNMILEASRRGAAVAAVSAKISHRSYKRYRLVRPLMRHVLSALACVCAQTEEDADRYRGLGMAPGKVRVTGDVKLDAELPEKPPAAPDWLPDVLGEGSKWLFCAGSTRRGEEETLGRAVLIAAESLGDGLTFVLAPRHIQRARSVFCMLREWGFNAAMKTTLGSEGWTGGAGPRALVLDTMGELAGVYTGCDVAFVGGTLSPHGGHNLAEPAGVGVPVFFGPHVDKILTVARPLLESGGGLMISGSEDLAAGLKRLLLDTEERARRGAAARGVIRSLQGATKRTLDFLAESGVLPLTVHKEG
jgi:3-deoxy-D-manno-octulosonic-acid transferase